MSRRFKFLSMVLAVFAAVVLNTPASAIVAPTTPASVTSSGTGLLTGPDPSVAGSDSGVFNSSASTVSLAGVGYFDWAADIAVGIRSRLWTQSAGNTTVSMKGPCYPNMPGGNYGITMHYSSGAQYGNLVTFRCGSQVQYTWTSMPGGTFYFFLSKPNDRVTVHVTGWDRYVS